MAFEGATEITILAPDHPRLLSVIAGACAASDANIVDAQIFTTTDGRALDTVIVSRAFDERRGRAAPRRAHRHADRGGAAGPRAAAEAIAGKRRKSRRRDAFTIEPQVTVTNELSDRFTVIEVECLDRPRPALRPHACMSELTLDIASAHIATFGENVVDTFYVTDLVGHKMTAKARQTRITARSPRRDRAARKRRGRQGARRLVSLVRQFVSVGGATLASRLLGFVRETLIAAALGAGPVADAFYAAFRFPNLFRRLFAEGAFNAAFVPLFAPR